MECSKCIASPILIAIPPDLGAHRSTSASAASAISIALAVALSCGNMSAESMAHLPLPCLVPLADFSFLDLGQGEQISLPNTLCGSATS